MPFLKELLEKHKKYSPQPDTELIKKAFEFAEVAHMGQKRLNGEDLIDHSLAVADILADFRAGSTSLAAALLHDVLEETDLDKEVLEEEFGEEIASLVSGLTRVKEASGKAVSGSRGGWENLRHLMLSTVKDPRILLVRLAEKTHNLQTAGALEEKRRKASAQKAFDVWAPLASTMGLYGMKSRIENLAFENLLPEECKMLKERIEAQKEKMEETVKKARQSISQKLNEEGIDFEIFSRVKHLYGVYRKMPRYKKQAGGRLYDVLGLRVVVGGVEECYRVLDIIRSLWKEIPELFDDYIANPKPNGYQSLHAVFEVGDQLIEIQIRTSKMHALAEYGLAAHPIYKLGQSGSGQREIEEKISLIKNLVSWEKGQDLDLFPDKVFVFTPKGDVKVLPKGSTPVDFAYAVHTRIGDECSGAQVNGRIRPLDYELKTGEMVKIITSKGKKPSSDWLQFVKTSHARGNIEKTLRRQR